MPAVNCTLSMPCMAAPYVTTQFTISSTKVITSGNADYLGF